MGRTNWLEFVKAREGDAGVRQVHSWVGGGVFWMGHFLREIGWQR